MKNILFLLLFLTSCANASLRIFPAKRGVDPVFIPYVKQYYYLISIKNRHKLEKYKLNIQKLSINFTNLEKNVIGKCTWLLSGELEIEIDKKWWNKSVFILKEFLIYHELEHCIRDRKHTNEKYDKTSFYDYFEYILQEIGLVSKVDYFSDGCPGSIMHPSDAGEWCSYNHYEDYIQEIINYKSL